MFTICDLKDKLFEIYSVQSCIQTVMVKKERRYDLVHNKHEKLANGGKYIVVQCLCGRARSQQRYNACYWHIIYLIENIIK